jgi:DUF1365 family protein
MHSCLYEGAVHHRRRGAIPHAFGYSLFLTYLDLDELDDVFRGRWLWSTRRPALARFRRTDHFGPPDQPLAATVRDLVQSRTGTRPEGSIRLLTHLRYFGYVMNPVSFYFCFDPHDALQAVVAEVTNTPWGETHCYVIEPSSDDESLSSGPPILRASHPKQLHVSPFLPMDLQYRWQIGLPGERLTIQIENEQSGERVFHASLTLQRRPIATAQLAGVLLRYPLMTARITAGIYWQALRLWWQGATFFPHPRHAAAVASSELSVASLRGDAARTSVTLSRHGGPS